jgi:copper oxidase (laccase) domain-containing protein
MRRVTKIFLVAGCALIVLLDADAALAALAAGWRGPYARADTRTADAATAARGALAAVLPMRLELARR